MAPSVRPVTIPTSEPRSPAGSKGSEARRVAAHATFELLVGLGLSRTIAFEIAWRIWGR